MRLRLAALVGAVVLALLAGYAVGRVANRPAAGAGATSALDAAPGIPAHSHQQDALQISGETSGLTVSAGGYTLVPGATSFVAGRAQPFTFHIQGPNGQRVRTFAVRNDKPMHLIVVRRDLSGYRHLHPSMAPDGTWGMDLSLPEPGTWRAYADFTATESGGGETSAVLGVDLVAAGAYEPRALAPPADVSTVDGMAVNFTGQFRVGPTQPLMFWVPAQVQPYLGAYGHLVILRSGDLLYVHVHPEPQLANGAVKFWTAAPSPGRYRMFFDFQVDGQVRTAEYTLAVGQS
ncbi:MAG TPA: hypothetical protein VFC00_16895 [Micromonosporaceae bacterium]|nr:hypothetical protein [Micromonosporaceae bacterium]